MKNVCYVRQETLGNVMGRIDYISSEDRQENLYATYATAPDEFWRALARENQADFLKNGTRGNCIEAREFIIALPPEMLRYDHDQLLRHFVDNYKERYGVECTAASHHNKKKSNFHIHMIYAERKELPNPEIKIASRNRYYSPEGKHVRTKKEVSDSHGNLLPGCKMIPKGEIYEQHRFQRKETKFKDKAFLDEAKEFFTGLMNPYLSERSQMYLFPKNSPYLPTKKIGKNNPRAKEITEANSLKEEWNKKVDVARSMRLPQESMLIVKKRLITEPIRHSKAQAGGKHDHNAFCNSLYGAVKVLGAMLSRTKRMSGQDYKAAWIDRIDEFITICMELVFGVELQNKERRTPHERSSYLR